MGNIVKMGRREKRLATIEIYEDETQKVRFRLVDMPEGVMRHISRLSEPGAEVSDRLREVAYWMRSGWSDFWNQARDIEGDAWKTANEK